MKPPQQDLWDNKLRWCLGYSWHSEALNRWIPPACPESRRSKRATAGLWSRLHWISQRKGIRTFPKGELSMPAAQGCPPPQKAWESVLLYQQLLVIIVPCILTQNCFWGGCICSCKLNRRLGSWLEYRLRNHPPIQQGPAYNHVSPSATGQQLTIYYYWRNWRDRDRNICSPCPLSHIEESHSIPVRTIIVR